MKRLLTLLLAALLLLLCACGRGGEAPAESPAPGQAAQGGSPEAAPAAAGEAAPVYTGSYRRVEITADNWQDYFELEEIPLYTVVQEDVIAQVCQYYCVVLRDEYRPYLKPGGDYSVRFELQFDLYIDTMDIDTNAGVYRHTDDLFYAVETVKTATFDRYALPAEAYGGEAGQYGAFSNAFFTGYCALHAESEVWSGFYIDLSQVKLVSVSGSLELGG